MNGLKPFQQHADAVRSDAFTGNLRRASLLPGEIAARPPVSQDSRAAAGTGSYAEPAGTIIYRRHLTDRKWPDPQHSHRVPGRERAWWYWPALSTAVILGVWGIVLAMSDSNAASLAH